MDTLSLRDRRVLRRLYDDHYEYVLRTCRRLGASANDADDVVQEVFLVIARKLGEIDIERPMRPFLFGVIRNCVRSERRHAFRFAGDPQNGEPVSSVRAFDEGAEMVHLALADLPEEQRAAVVLLDLEGHTALEAAAILELSVSTVRSRIRSARERLRSFITQANGRMEVSNAR